MHCVLIFQELERPRLPRLSVPTMRVSRLVAELTLIGLNFKDSGSSEPSGIKARPRSGSSSCDSSATRPDLAGVQPCAGRFAGTGFRLLQRVNRRFFSVAYRVSCTRDYPSIDQLYTSHPRETQAPSIEMSRLPEINSAGFV